MLAPLPCARESAGESHLSGRGKEGGTRAAGVGPAGKQLCFQEGGDREGGGQ